MYVEVTSDTFTGEVVHVRGTHLRPEQVTKRVGVLTDLGMEGWRLVTTTFLPEQNYVLDTLFREDDSPSSNPEEDLEELKTIIAKTQPKFEVG